MKAYLYSFFLFITLFLSSCVRPYYVSTNTYADMSVIPNGFHWKTSFAIVSESKENSLFIKEVSYKVSRFLQESGYSVQDIDTADYVLVFNCEMSDTKTLINVPFYVPGPTQIREGHLMDSGGTTCFQETTETGTTVFMPEEVTVYNRNLCLKVYPASEYRQNHKEEVWQGSANSSGSNGDFRDSIDYLLVSAFRYFGVNTKRDVHITLNENDPVIQWLRH